jgi:hypothetical protein
MPPVLQSVSLARKFIIFRSSTLSIAVSNFTSRFLVTGGSNANVPAAVTYQSTNIVGQWRRAFCNATIVGAGGIGGIIGSLAFRTQDAPNYRPGLYCCFVAAALTIVSVTTTTVYMTVKNKLQAQGRTVIEGVEGFRYSI